MDNEEKILHLLEKMQGDISGINERLDIIQEDIEQIKEDTMVTRTATNTLIEWADNVAIFTQVQYPVKKQEAL